MHRAPGLLAARRAGRRAARLKTLQKEYLSTRYATNEPEWIPNERFESRVRDIERSRLDLQVVDPSCCGGDRTRCVASIKVATLADGSDDRVFMIPSLDQRDTQREWRRGLPGESHGLPWLTIRCR